MSAIPPNWLASGIQAQGAQKRAVDERDKDAAQQARTTGGAAFARELIDVVETSDRDSQADPDAEGAGSQGKAYSDPDESKKEPQEDTNPPAGGLDIQA